MEGREVAERVHALERARGETGLFLRIGDWRFRVDGLDDALAAALERRWGGHVVPDNGMEPVVVLRIVDGGDTRFEQESPGEVYRIESDFGRPRHPVLWSYRFAAVREGGDRERWKLAVGNGSENDPEERMVENVVRYLVARTAVGSGGIALHAAGVLHEGRAWLFAGGSRAGKSTAVKLSRPRVSLGDDFALCVPSRRVWLTAAVPFDNSERAPDEPPGGWIPVAGIWRLHQAASTRLETPPALSAVSSLMGCVAFPSALQDLSGSILRHVQAYVEEARFGDLHFDLSPDFWKKIDRVRPDH
jgi:hypothetical protein